MLDTLAYERIHLTRSGRVAVQPPKAVGKLTAPPVELAIVSQREGVVAAGGHGNEPALSLSQAIDPPGQHLGLQRAVAERTTPAVPNRKDGAGVGHCQGEPEAEGDAQHAILRERLDPLKSQLRIRFRVKSVAQTVWHRFLVDICRPTPREESAVVVDRRAVPAGPSRDTLNLAERLDPARHISLAPVAVAERAEKSVAPRVDLAFSAKCQAVPVPCGDAHDAPALHRWHQQRGRADAAGLVGVDIDPPVVPQEEAPHFCILAAAGQQTDSLPHPQRC